MLTFPPAVTTCSTPAATKRQTIAHVTVCLGCCCGRVDKGQPAVPVDWLKAEWKARRLLKKVQLTISGCMGPCDVPNIVSVASQGVTVWLCHFTHQAHYDALLEWATNTAAADRLLPLPEIFSPLAFDRFTPSFAPGLTAP